MSKKHHPGEETENGMVRKSAKSACSADLVQEPSGQDSFLEPVVPFLWQVLLLFLVYIATGAFMYLMMRAIR